MDKEENKWKHLMGDPNDPFVNIDPEIRDKFHKLPQELKEKSLKAKTFMVYPFEVLEQQKKPFEQKEKETLEFIENHLKTFKKPYVATSFGSDSIVLMHLVMRACKNLGIEYPDMFLNDTLNTFKEEKQYWADISKEWGIIDKVKLFKPPVDEKGNMYTVWSIAKKYGHLPHFRTMGRGKTWQKLHPNSKDKNIRGQGSGTPECCDILKKATLKKYLKSLPVDERYDCQFVGTRAQESRMRMVSVLQRCRSYIYKTFVNYPIRTVTPLSYWTKDDVWKYYEVNNIPKNPAYPAHDLERMGCASCPAHKNWEIRLAKDPTNEGFGMLKMNFKLMKEFIDNGTENPQRLTDSIDTLKRYMKKDGRKLNEQQQKRVLDLIKEYTHEDNLDDFVS